MKAIVLTEASEYQLVELPAPAPGPGEVAIQVAYAGIQWGDVLVKQGHFPVRRPFVPGFEAAGRIVEVGEAVDPGRIGEAVAAMTSGGAFAEVVVARSTLAIPIGDLALRTAGGLGWIVPTAYDLIHTRARVRAGEAVLIHAAAGGVGTIAAQLANQAGARRVVGVVEHDDQVAYAVERGYATVITHTRFPEALGGEKFDVVLDPIGGATREASVAVLAPHGRLVVYGNIATFEPVRISANDLLMEGKSVLTYNSNLLAGTHPESLAESARRGAELVAQGLVTVDLSAEYPLSDVATGVQRLADGNTRGKSIVRVTA